MSVGATVFLVAINQYQDWIPRPRKHKKQYLSHTRLTFFLLLTTTTGASIFTVIEVGAPGPLSTADLERNHRRVVDIEILLRVNSQCIDIKVLPPPPWCLNFMPSRIYLNERTSKIWSFELFRQIIFVIFFYYVVNSDICSLASEKQI